MHTQTGAGAGGGSGRRAHGIPLDQLPRALVCLADDQVLEVRVTARRPFRGVWWYELVLTLPDRRDTPRGPVRDVTEIAFSAPYPDVQPIPGEDYTILDPPPAEECRRWRLSEAPPGSPHAVVVHRLDCAQGGMSQQLATDREALRMLADPEEAVTCSICRADRVLCLGEDGPFG
ncbi:DUF6233 domain-containing protein [Streptomyces sp. URMC 127]|uniref:DUF6233 domain-containing protein n=1 Tax=Streptomyces sp. URMC 127 TaxID=3423402 RepID=UPI003F1D8671